MKISVLLPTYNRKRFIIDSIESIINQTYSNFTIYIYDDGSTDNTDTLLASKYRNNPKIIYKKSPLNKGICIARNELLEMAESELCCWQDSDDISHRDRLQTQINKIKEGYDVVSTCHMWMHTVPEHDFIKVHKSDNMAHASIMFNKSQSFKFDISKSRGGEDADWLRKMVSMGYKHYNIKQALYYVRHHKDRISSWRKNPGLNQEWCDRMDKLSEGNQ